MRKKIHINMCPILDGYGVMGIFEFPYTPSCEPCLTEPAGGVMLSASLVADFSQLQTVQFPLSRYLGGMPGRWGVQFWTRSSQPSGSLCCSRWWHFRKPALSRYIQIKGNFRKLTLHLYFKCIMYYASLLFCSVYCQ